MTISGNVSVVSYSATNVPTNAYVSIGAMPTSCRALQIIDTSGKIIKIATGAPGSEVDVATVVPSTNQTNFGIVIPIYIPAGQPISLKAVDATANSGYNLLSFL
jgi:hypothetical protein